MNVHHILYAAAAPFSGRDAHDDHLGLCWRVQKPGPRQLPCLPSNCRDDPVVLIAPMAMKSKGRYVLGCAEPAQASARQLWSGSSAADATP